MLIAERQYSPSDKMLNAGSPTSEASGHGCLSVICVGLSRLAIGMAWPRAQNRSFSAAVSTGAVAVTTLSPVPMETEGTGSAMSGGSLSGDGVSTAVDQGLRPRAEG